MQKLDHLVPVVLRLGLAVVFIWFGAHQLIDPSSWTVYIPAFTNNPLISAETIILLNGWVEIVGAALLLAGFWMRPVAFILAIHMLFLAIEMGGAIGVRDFGLAIACLALALSTPDRWTLDHKLETKRVGSTI
ncbi:MAG: DoxX family protein [Patescibacteria group bacterium]